MGPPSLLEGVAGPLLQATGHRRTGAGSGGVNTGMDSTATSPAATASPLPALGIALAGALLIGFLTSFAQGWLPAPISSLANASGSWSLVAFLLALLDRRMWVSVGIGVLALVAMVLGYDLASILRGSGVSPFYTLFWVRPRSRSAPCWGGAPICCATGTGGRRSASASWQGSLWGTAPTAC